MEHQQSGKPVRKKLVEAVDSVEEVALMQLRLLGAELRASSKSALFSVVFIIVGSAGLIFVLVFAAITAALAIHELGLPIWLAFLIMTGVLLLIAILLLILGVKAFSKIKAPTRALKSWQETKDIIAGK
ncbi:MAG: phage holin family protein [Actinobacteria bacterium]|nr:phage holin family protein [Actinomycetota bacterium]